MNNQALALTISKLAVKGKGILAADESVGTISKRFQAVGIESTEANRLAYRELLMTAPGIEQFIAGVILHEETLYQTMKQGVTFPKWLAKCGIMPGIKVDKGLVTLANTNNENITQGLDGLPERLEEYKKCGAVFAKWRAVYTISETTPSPLAIKANAEVLARYAAICQNAGIVPIVEPEVLIDGNHTLARCEEVTVPVLHAVFNALFRHKVSLEHIVLKPSMVISGKTCLQQADVMSVATATLQALRRTVPACVPTINFLSGGQSSEAATAHLNAMNQQTCIPWNLSYSYARALQEDAMRIWKGQEKNVEAAQKAFLKRARLNSLAATGRYSADIEKTEVFPA